MWVFVLLRKEKYIDENKSIMSQFVDLYNGKTACKITHDPITMYSRTHGGIMHEHAVTEEQFAELCEEMAVAERADAE